MVVSVRLVGYCLLPTGKARSCSRYAEGMIGQCTQHPSFNTAPQGKKIEANYLLKLSCTSGREQ